MNAAGTSLQDPNWVQNVVDYAAQYGVGNPFQGMGNTPYTQIMNSDINNLVNDPNQFQLWESIEGALNPIVSNKDYSNGAYFFNFEEQLTNPLQYPDIGNNYRSWANGIFTWLGSSGGFDFFTYSNYPHWP